MAATSGVIPYSSVPGWPSPPAGLLEACEAALTAAGFSPFVSRAADGVHVSDVPTVNAVLAGYVGGASELAFAKTAKQAALDDFWNTNFDFGKFVRNGTATNLTGANVGTFLATAFNNYRTLRASISGAANVAAVTAVNINSGWPANP